MNQFKEIWLPLADRFYRVAYYLLESQEDAEDAAFVSDKNEDALKLLEKNLLVDIDEPKMKTQIIEEARREASDGNPPPEHPPEARA